LEKSGIWRPEFGAVAATPITFDAAKTLGLPVRSDIPAEFLNLLSLYPQPVKQQPTVEYRPVPRRFESSERLT